jgi:hypothetical protein
MITQSIALHECISISAHYAVAPKKIDATSFVQIQHVVFRIAKNGRQYLLRRLHALTGPKLTGSYALDGAVRQDVGRVRDQALRNRRNASADLKTTRYLFRVPSASLPCLNAWKDQHCSLNRLSQCRKETKRPEGLFGGGSLLRA